MNDPLLKTLSAADSAGYTGSGKNQILSIELSLDGFSFGIFDSRNMKPLLIESYQIQDDLTPEHLAASIHELVIKSTILLLPFEKVHLAWYHQQYTLVPNELYHHSAKERYHSLCTNSPEGHFVNTDELSNLYAYGVYPFPEVLNHKLKILFPNIVIKHLATVLIEYVLTALKLEKDGHSVFMHIRSRTFEILIFNYKRLIFYNSFSYQGIDDLMYYLFYVLEQYKLDTSKMIAFLGGEINANSPVLHHLTKYFREISIAPEYLTSIPHDRFEQVPKHVYQNLVNLAICE
ncbi:MAG TPA: DUF3822 family protein [Bacteroidales bacterium]|nr:DUF3822 family protein [Bacteroidales bacterium]